MDSKVLSKRIREHGIKMTSSGKSSHIGSVLSIADIIAVLYANVLKVNPRNPQWKERDRFILSKGHAGAAVYAALAEYGFFPTSWLADHCACGSKMCGHVSHIGIPGVEFSTGSLGHGLPVAAGMAFACKSDKNSHRVYVLLSDGECDEGSNWEAILFAAHHGLSNLIAIIDYNKIQSLATVEDTLRLEPFADKWRAFGWNTVEVDGHNHKDLQKALEIKPQEEVRPTCIIAHTVKGKGVSFMENSVLWHYRSPQGEEFKAALDEINRVV